MTKWQRSVRLIWSRGSTSRRWHTQTQRPDLSSRGANNLPTQRRNINFDSALNSQTMWHKSTANLLFLQHILLNGSQGGVVALLEPAGGQVPLVLILQAGVFLAKVRHLELQLINPDPLLLQQPLLGLDDLIQLL